MLMRFLRPLQIRVGRETPQPDGKCNKAPTKYRDARGTPSLRGEAGSTASRVFLERLKVILMDQFYKHHSHEQKKDLI